MKPCPFCGSTAKAVHLDDDLCETPYMGVYEIVGCTSCNACSPICGSEEGALEAWDERTPGGDCPFCGGKSKVSRYDDTESPYIGTTLWQVVCEECGAFTAGHEFRREAVAAWKRRTEP